MKKICALLAILCSLAVAGCNIFSDGNAKNEVKQPAQTEVKQLSFIVYRPAADGSEKLLPERITMQDNGKSAAENALLTLINEKPKDKKMEDIVPQNTKVLGFKVDKNGTAYVDLSKEIVKHGEGSYNEFMLTGAVVNTLTEFPEIKRVQILVEGKKTVSLGGHIDVEDAMERNETLL